MWCKGRRALFVAALPLLFLALSPAPALADPEYRYDEQGRLIMVIKEDGTVISYTYDAEGKRIKNEAGEDQRVDFDAHGRPAPRCRRPRCS